MGFAYPAFDFLVRHVIVEPDADPMAGTHVVGRTHRIVTGFQFINHVRVALNGAGIEFINIEETENLAPDIKRQYGLRGAKCLKRHLLAAAGQREAKFPEFFYIHRCDSL